MPNYRVILVETKYGGNVGATARVMRNFDQEELVLVEPPTLGDEAKERAMHAWDVIERARRVETFEEAIRGCDFVVGTSAKIPRSEKNHTRNPLDASELAPRLEPMSGTVGLCFGREDFGLFNEELEKCDLLVTIPTGPLYKSLNLSHAVAIVLYELFANRQQLPVKSLTPMSEEMRLTFQRNFDTLIEQLALPEHKVKGTKLAYRKLLGRAVPSAWEYYVLMGILSRVLQKYGVEVESGRFDVDFDLPEAALDEGFQMLLDETSS